MTLHRWSGGPPPDQLGSVAHGPVLVARSPGIVVGLRCVFAHPDGLDLLLVLRAKGVQAEAAMRQTVHEFGAEGAEHHRWSEPTVLVQIDDVRGQSYPYRAETSAGDDDYATDLHCWIDALPADGRLTITASWPQAGLAQASVTLELDGLGDLERRSCPLL